MCSPMLQYRSISSLLTAATARPRAASIRRNTSSKSAGDGVVKAIVRDGTFLDLATRHLLAMPQLTIARHGEAIGGCRIILNIRGAFPLQSALCASTRNK